MSTLAYAALTNRRIQATPGTSGAEEPPGVKSYVDAVAALVPAEVLSLHAVILSITTSRSPGTDGNTVTTITQPGTLRWAFFGFIVLSVVLYVVPRFQTRDRLDFLRGSIPPLAFVAWTMLQRTTAFDAVWPSLGDAPRTAIALFAAVVLGLMAAKLAGKADQTPPPPKN
jgi:hypothetical protein